MKHLKQIKEAVAKIKSGVGIDEAVKDLPKIYADLSKLKDPTLPKKIPQYKAEDSTTIESRVANHFCRLVELSVNTSNFKSFSNPENKVDSSGRIKTTISDLNKARYVNLDAKRDELIWLQKSLDRLVA